MFSVFSGYDCHFGTSGNTLFGRMTPMSTKTLTPSVTVRDSKGLKFLEVVGAAYNKAGLSEDEAQRVNQAGGLADLIASHIAQHRAEKPPLLKLVDKVSASGAKRFVSDKASLKEANIGWTNSDFDKFFLGKVEESIKDATIVIHVLQKGSLDAPIRKELGEQREETTLTHFFDLLKKQSNGQEGHLLVNGYANIAYIRDKAGKLWAVDAYWYSDDRYWSVRASSVECPHEWDAGRRVLSSDC
jgi:hypothetical protein